MSTKVFLSRRPLSLSQTMCIEKHNDKQALKNRQSITSCSFLRLFLLRISYLSDAGLEGVSKQHFCKTPSPGKFQRSGNIGSRSAESVEGSDSIVTLSHSLTHSLTQKDSLVAYA